jgi:nitroreductase
MATSSIATAPVAAAPVAAAAVTAAAVTDGRLADHAILPLFTARWSARALSGAVVTDAELARVLEAARWAPSGANTQPWRFVYAQAGTPEFARFLELLVPGNRLWSERAGALVAIVSQSTLPDGRAHPSHAFDAGAAWMSLSLQAAAMGLVAHAMGGFDRAAAPGVLGLPAGYVPHVLVALGHPGDPAALPESLRGRERPSDRKPLSDIAFRGLFRA